MFVKLETQLHLAGLGGRLQTDEGDALLTHLIALKTLGAAVVEQIEITGEVVGLERPSH